MKRVTRWASLGKDPDSGHYLYVEIRCDGADFQVVGLEHWDEFLLDTFGSAVLADIAFDDILRRAI
jgi:hypothetical protein